MTTFDAEITVDDFGSFDWQAIIESAEKHDCHIYSRLFFDEAKRLTEAGGKNSSNLCVLMGIITSFMMNWDARRAPFKSEKEIKTEINFSPSTWNTLLAIVPEIRDAELRARIADILWVIKVGKYQIARLAVDAYLEVARNTEDPQDWFHGFYRIERAYQLAAQLGKGDYFEKVITYIEDVLDRLNGEDPLWFSNRLMGLLLDARIGDPAKYIALAEKNASNAVVNHDWRRAREYWEVEARWLEKANLLDEQKSIRLQAAETYVNESKDRLNEQSPNYWAATHELSLAIEAMRRMSAPKELIDQVHKMLLECQEKSTANMQEHSFSLDLTDPINRAKDAVKGKSLRDAILFLAGNYYPNTVDALRKHALDSQKENPLTSFIHYQLVNEKGRVTATRPGVSFDGDQDSNEKALVADMYRQAQFSQNISAVAEILPIIDQINSEHYIRLDDLLEFVVNNPFIPRGHEMIFARGLYAGLTNDFLIAAHLLLPQIENSIRYLLYQRRVITSEFDAEGIQDEYPLGKLLYMPETERVFNADILFDLRGLLVERFGTNLRNNAAHGLMYSNSFESEKVIYFWRVVLYLCCVPALTQADKESTGDNADSSTENDA